MKTHALIPLLLLAALPADAATNIFTPATGTWNTTTNWTLGTVPSSADTAFINSARVATVAANAPDVGSINVGNTANTTVSALIIEADLTADSLFVATGAGALAEVVQTGGTLTVNSTFLISNNGAAASSGTYTISGGALDFSGATLNVGGSAPGTLTIDGSAVSSVAGNGMNVGAQGTVEFKLGQFGVTPIQITTNVNVNATGQLVVDGTDYEGLDGYFPLMSYAAIGPQFDPANVTFIGLADRSPAVVHESGCLWLRLGAPPAFSTKLLSLVPESTVATDLTDSNFSATRDFDPSGSDWATTYNEGHVMDTLLEVDVDGESHLSLALRVGRGGNVYSLRTSQGETVPPQLHVPDDAPWIDEVWQAVSVDGTLNDPPGANHGGNPSPWFIHQSGVYLRDPILTEPFYSPQVAAQLDVANRSFTTINWGQQAHIGIFTDGVTSNDFQSHHLYFTRYKDLGQGVIEVSTGQYNYGPDNPNFFNEPWGGTRRSTYNHAFLANPLCDTGFTWSAAKTNNFGSLVIPFNETGGWWGYSGAENGTSPALGNVFGRGTSFVDDTRFGYAGSFDSTNETGARNFLVTTQRRRGFSLSQGEGFWSRFYFTTGDSVADMADRIAARDLGNINEFRTFEYTESNSPLVGYSFTGSGASFEVTANESTPDFYLYAHPVTGSFPIYELIESDGSRYLTWNPYETGVIKTYDGTIAGIRLLGFALPTAAINTTYTYQALATVLAGVTPDNYKPSGEVFSVRTTGDTADDDGDGLANFVETSVHGSDPNDADTDGDGFTDSQEVALGANPAVDDSGLIALIMAAVGGETSRIQLTPSGDDFTVTVKVQESTDLSAFSDLDLTGVNTTVDAGADTVTITISGAAASKFLRIGK